MEINSPDFSTEVTYRFTNNKIIAYKIEIPITITDNTIQAPNTAMHYRFEGDYLLLETEGSNQVGYFLSRAKFLEKYPEFQPKEENYEGRTVALENATIKADFNYPGGFSSYLVQSEMADFFEGKNELTMEFVLTKESKIVDPKILNSTSKKYSEKALEVLKRAEIYFVNTTGRDLLIKKRMKTSGDDRMMPFASKDRRIVKIVEKGDKFYNNNEFENAITEYEKLKTLDPKDLNNYYSKRALKNLGISYLAINKMQEACTNFNMAGSLTDFSVRNYLINFCEK